MTAKSVGSCWGVIETRPLGSDRAAKRRGVLGPVEIERQAHYWRPIHEISGALPHGYCVSLNSMSLRGGDRRFHTDEPNAFLLNASLGGFAILCRVKQLTPAQRNTYNLMRLVFQYGPLVQEKLTRTLKRPVDLLAVANQVGSRDILPEDLGLDAAGNGTRWTVGRLMLEGQKEAEARQLCNVSQEQIIRLGLVAAARLNRLPASQLTVEEAARLLRLVLFDLGAADVPIDEPTKEEVIERFQRALHNHLGDSTAEFDKWFFAQRDGIVRQISTKKSGPGPIERAVVRDVLLDLVFEALRYTGQCVHVLMRDFLRAVDPPLDTNEQGDFELLYNAQRWLGGVPLIMLHRYFGPVREAMLDLWADPGNPENIGLFLRVLQYHARMVSKRREADRMAKRVGPAAARSEFPQGQCSAEGQSGGTYLRSGGLGQDLDPCYPGQVRVRRQNSTIRPLRPSNWFRGRGRCRVQVSTMFDHATAHFFTC